MRINVYKREGKKGVRWYLDYFWGGQRCRYPVADTRKVAEEIKARIQVQVAEGSFKGPRATEDQQAKRAWTFGELCDEWLRVRKPRLKRATVAFYEEIFSGLKERVGTGRIINQITVRDCQRIIAAKRAEGSRDSRSRSRSIEAFLTLYSLLFTLSPQRAGAARWRSRCVPAARDRGRAVHAGYPALPETCSRSAGSPSPTRCKPRPSSPK